MAQDKRDTVGSDWLQAGFSAVDAQALIDAAVPIAVARQWADAGIAPDDAFDYLEKGVPAADIGDLQERGIETWQIARNDSGYEVELQPWQEDPITQLPQQVTPGRVRLSLWSAVPWDGTHIESEVSLEWDGGHTVEWSVLSGSGLSVMSELAFSGLAGWPDGRDLLVSYSGDTGEYGFSRLTGDALAADSPGETGNPEEWVKLAMSLVGLADQLANSGIEPREEFAAEYQGHADDEWFEFDDVFRHYLASANTNGILPDFDDWLGQALDAGTYRIA